MGRGSGGARAGAAAAGAFGCERLAAPGRAGGGGFGACRPAGRGAAESGGGGGQPVRYCLGGSRVRGGVSGSGYRRGDRSCGGRGGSDSIVGSSRAVGGGGGRLGHTRGENGISASGLVVGGGTGGGSRSVARSFSGCGRMGRRHGPATSGPRGERERAVVANHTRIGSALGAASRRPVAFVDGGPAALSERFLVESRSRYGITKCQALGGCGRLLQSGPRVAPGNQRRVQQPWPRPAGERPRG